ncbi:MAG TPA: hypothetical protein VNA88_12260 [Candidatus Kapabacteria bacterium]|nr:hypothetical protein [Candidatus Kapabacteria bacterium]
MIRTILIALASAGILTIASCGGARQSARTEEATPALTPSTMTRDSALALMRALEAAPLGRGASVDRQRAFEWLASTDDLDGIAIDGRYLRPLEESEYPFAGELLMQFGFGIAMHRMSPEGEASDHAEQVEAGLRSVIAAYRNMVREDVKLGDKFLDDLDQIRRLGKLREYIAKVDEQSR